jgi:DNA polymerase-3 subunit alpha
MVSTVVKLGSPALALTDHGSMVNIVDFHTECKKNKIKPILGCEFYVAYEGIQNKEATKLAKTDTALARESDILGVSHLILLAKNFEGYQNLCRLLAIAHTDGFYYQPRIDYDLLAQHSNGLICSTACMFGDFFKLTMHDHVAQQAKAPLLIEKLKGIFGNDLYIELQNHGFKKQVQFLPKAIKSASDQDVKLVISQDVHYAAAKDAKFQDALYCVGKHKIYGDSERMAVSGEMYFKTRRQLEAMFSASNVPASAFDNTLEIAEKVTEYEIAPKDYLLPKMYSTKEESERHFRDLCNVGWKELIAPNIKDPALREVYKQRAAYEMRIISQMGFTDYFLIVQDYLDHARKTGILVGPGRGSAAGCLVSYLIGITKEDPILYGLLFERFLVPGRPTMPDIDVDVSDRDEVIRYLETKYGKDKVAPIINRTAATSKAALIKVGTILGSFQLGRDLSALIPTFRGETPTFDEAFAKVPELQIRERETPELFELARGLEGVYVGLGGHASGVIVSSVPLTDIIPLHRTKDIVYTAYDGDQLKKLKLVKLDILNVDVLRTISDCVKMIKERHGVDIDPYKIPMDDKQTYDLICEGDTVGVFQFESNMMREILKKVKPRNILEIAAVNAIGRPGALDADGLVGTYVNRKRNLEPIVYPHPVLQPILEETYGLMIYQEQVMLIAKTLASYTDEETDKFRKAMSDKDVSIIENQREKFLAGALKNEYPKEFVETVFENIKKFAGYGFNKSHAVAYGHVGYITAYLKAHYPMEFLLSSLNKEIRKGSPLEFITKFVVDLEKHNYSVKGPSVVSSGWEFEPHKTETDTVRKPVIYYGLGGIKGISPKQMEDWIARRPFKSLDDCVVKGILSGVNSRSLELLAELGCFSELAPNIVHVAASMSLRIDKARKLITRARSKKKKSDQQTIDLFLGGETAFNEENLEFDMGDRDLLFATQSDLARKALRIKAEIEHIGFAISGTLLDEYEEQVRRRANCTTSSYVSEIGAGSTARVAGVITKMRKCTDRHGRRMAFLSLSDGRTEIRAVVFGTVFERIRPETRWKEGAAIVVDGRKDERDGETLLAKDLVFLRKEVSGPDEEAQEVLPTTTKRPRSSKQHRSSTPSSPAV